MIENRRFTRSSASALRNTQNNEAQIKQLQEIELKIKKATMGKQYKQALSLVSSINPQNHWTLCKKAHLLYQMGRTPRSLNALRTALKFQSNNCVQCLKLLLKIIEQSQPYIKPFERDIQNCLAIEKMPSKMKAEFVNLQDKIQTQQDQNSRIGEEERAKIQQFTSYYANKGLIFKKVELVQIQEQYRYARAKSTIKANQVIIFVPQKQMITLQMAKQQGDISRLSGQQSKFKSPKHSILSAFLLVHMQKGQESPYYNYIQCLPKKLTNFPIYYSDALLQELKGTYFQSLIKRKKQDIDEDYKQLIGILPQLAHIVTYQKFQWARMVVSSRIFGVVMSGRKTDALVPIADMLNHKIPKMTSWYFSDQKRGFVVQNSDKEIPKGNQIFDSYGYKCNSRFLLNYGFTMHQNTCNQVLIVLQKRTSAKPQGLSYKLATDIGSDQFKTILKYLRHSLPAMERVQGSDHHQKYSKYEGFISDYNECEVWRKFQKIIKQQMSAYKTSIRTDEKLLRSTDSSQFNLRNCIVIRLGEKRVLDFYMKMSKKMIDYFSNKRMNLDVKEYETYLKEVRESSVLLE